MSLTITCRRWSEQKRHEQFRRLKSLQIQCCMKQGLEARGLVLEQQKRLPEAARVDVPSEQLFGRVLGFHRTYPTLKRGFKKLELSANDCAELLQMSPSQYQACMRWLECEPIAYNGAPTEARPLGWLHRCRRTALAVLDGVERKVNRTSTTVLTELGKAALGIWRTYKRNQLRRQRRMQRQGRQERQQAGHIDPPPKPKEPEQLELGESNPATGNYWLRQIGEMLGRQPRLPFGQPA